MQPTAFDRRALARMGAGIPLALGCFPMVGPMWPAILSAALVAGALPMPGAALAQQLRIEQRNDQVVLRDGQRTMLVYCAAPGPCKPYVKEWFTFGGLQVLEDAPPDHAHHHGLMLAIGVDGVDFWGEAPAEKPGRQVPRGRIAANCQSSSQNGRTTSHATIEQTLDWQDAEGTPLLEEVRTIAWHRLPEAHAVLMTWTSRLAPPAGREGIELWGRHYFGLGMRLGPTGEKPPEFINSSGEPGQLVRGSERLCRATWCACLGVIGGQKFTAAAFDHPDNPRAPATFFTMNQPFAYLSATLDLNSAPLKLPAGKSITLRYGLALWDGHVDAGEIARAARAWQQLVQE